MNEFEMGESLQQPLLKTKINIPPLRPELVDRPRLVERIEQSLHGKLTLVSAPAGFGKTTLLVAWAGRCPRPVAWLTLEDSDNDPARFIAYCLAALQVIHPELGRGLSFKLQPLHRSAREAVLTRLLNELSEIPAPIALVLDDYHVIAEETVHASVAFLVEHLPPQVHIVVSSRADPPLPLAALRARGQLNEVRASELRFDSGETAAFMNRLMGFHLSRQELDALSLRTEGWIAGLQMAAVSLQGRDDAAAFIAAFTGSNRYVLDYLVEEVFQRQPEHVQSFLRRTSILERLTGPLCDALTGQLGGQKTLDLLERGGLFIEPLDAERRWYRYHRIFAELLRLRLARDCPQDIPELHRRAAAWFQEHGFPAEAIVHTLARGDHEMAAQLIEAGAEQCLMRGETSSFVEWVGMLPEALVRSRPRLCIYHALALLLLGNPVEKAQALIAHADKCSEEDSVHGELLAFGATMAFLEGNFADSVDQGRHALEHLDEGSLFRILTIRLLASAAYIESGDVEATIRTVEENVHKSRAAHNLAGAIVCLCELAELHIARAELGRAKAAYEEAWHEAVGSNGQAPPIAGLVQIGLGGLWREWNELDQAETCFDEGIALTKGFGVIGGLEGNIGLAWVRQAKGDCEGALVAMNEAQRLATQFDASDLDDTLVTLNRARLWTAQNRLQQASRWAERWIEERKGLRSMASYFIQELAQTTLARVRLAEGRVHEALRVLDELLQEVQRLKRHNALIETHALRALCLWRLDRRDAALAVLEEALRYAESEGYVRLFLDCPPPMNALLYEAAARGIGGPYTGKLLAALDRESPAVRPQGKAEEILEPLSTRELEVLRLLAQGLSNKQVADRLFISLPTVKWHTSNIYAKLGVPNRTRAAARARSIGLIPLA
ncbi:MAG: hypothetical protein JW820_11485 [Spirochaetales bacterium]|nr:hypothetical protein [Spirochaetales bacterium]